MKHITLRFDMEGDRIMGVCVEENTTNYESDLNLLKALLMLAAKGIEMEEIETALRDELNNMEDGEK